MNKYLSPKTLKMIKNDHARFIYAYCQTAKIINNGLYAIKQLN